MSRPGKAIEANDSKNNDDLAQSINIGGKLVLREKDGKGPTS